MENIQEIKEFQTETGRRFEDFFDRFGDVSEYLIRKNLLARFRDLGFTFTKASETEITDRNHDIFLSIEAFLENGERTMAFTRRKKPRVEDIDYHIECMEKLRQYADLHNDKRKYLGAIGGEIFSEAEKIYALKKGFYVVEPSGETFAITEPKGLYHPREW